MKIYPGLNDVKIVSKVDLKREVPLAYVDTNYITPTLELIIEPDFKKDVKEPLLPYEIVDNTDITLYKKDGEPLQAAEQTDIFLKDNEGRSYYMPKASKIFDPLLFQYQVLAKKNMEYESSRKYYINTSCFDTELAKRLITYFADANSRGLCPSNIIFNNNDIKLSSLLNSTMTDTDFLFMEETGYEQKEIDVEGKTEEEIELEKEANAEALEKHDKEMNDIINTCLDNNIVLWIITDRSAIKSEESMAFDIETNTAMNTDLYDTDSYFNLPADNKDSQYHKIFTSNKYAPVIVEERTKKGFIIKSTKQFIDDLSLTYKMFYEIIIRVYLKSYISTETTTEWISDVMPDYVVKNNSLMKKDKFTSSIEFYRMVNLEPGDATPITVNITSDDNLVYFVSLSNNYLVFKKIVNKEHADPIKGENEISIYTSRKNIMFYDSMVYKIQENIQSKIKYYLDDGKLKVSIAPFKNTYLDMKNCNSSGEVLTADINKNAEMQSFYIIYDKELNSFILAKDYIKSDTEVKIAEVRINSTKTSTKIYDMRVRGGGAKENSTNSDILYNCLDIGNPLGRPYRKGGALIVTINIPEDYQDKEKEIYDIIYETLDKNKIADDYLMLKINFV